MFTASGLRIAINQIMDITMLYAWFFCFSKNAMFSCLDIVMSFRDKHDCLEREVLQHRHKVTTLQEKLDSVTKVMFIVFKQT